jgi:hypothetical protein
MSVEFILDVELAGRHVVVLRLPIKLECGSGYIGERQVSIFG